MSQQAFGFHWADYLVFSLSLAMGLVIGLAALLKGRKSHSNNNVDDYLLGGGNMNVFMVGASMSVSILNAIFLLGGTAEFYARGAIYGLSGIANFLTLPFIMIFIVPSWKSVNVTSAYEYLELRFNSLPLRLWGATLFCIKIILFLAVVLYTPAMALSQVSGLTHHIAIAICGAVCVAYTIMGGLKAVVWTDALQALIILIGLVIVTIMGSVQAGGPTHVYDRAKHLGRFNFNNFNPDPRERHTVWGVVIGSCFIWPHVFISDQIFVQRLMAVKDTRAAQKTLLTSSAGSTALAILVASLGIVMSVYYEDCDPHVAGLITRGDQILPHFFMELLGDYPGLPGLFIAAIFAAALSTVSSSINSLAAVVLEDFMKPLKQLFGSSVSPKNEHLYAKVISFLFGVLAIGLSYLAPYMGPIVLQIPPTVYGAVGSSLSSAFLLGFYVSWSNVWGAFGGSAIGLVISLWLGVGSILYGKSPLADNLPVGQCIDNITDTYSAHYVDSHSISDPVQYIYDISYLWIGLIGTVTSILSGLLISGLAHYTCMKKHGVDKSRSESFTHKAKDDSMMTRKEVMTETLNTYI